MISFILTDIEGTTTSVKFVYDVLFPYFKKYFLDFYQKNASNTEVQNALQLTQKTILEEENREISTEQSLDMILHWTEIDRKHTALKILQGMVWKEGYDKGEILGHIYADVPLALEKWKNQNIAMGIYSSGSVAAQKLLFGTTEFGNLNPYFSAYFDTNIGHKREITSYQNIQKSLNIPAGQILFLSDIPQELSAAQAAGFQVIQLVREGTLADNNFKQVKDFSEIVI